MSDKLKGVTMAQEAKEMENSERLAVLETELRQVSKNVSAINDKLDVWNQSYVPRNEINMIVEARDKEIGNIKDELKSMEHNKWSLRNLWPAWLGVLIAIISLVGNYL